MIILEVLVDDEGSVADVGFLMHTKWDPPWPEFDEAAATAIRKWKYDPATLEGSAVPFCVTVTVNINFK